MLYVIAIVLLVLLLLAIILIGRQSGKRDIEIALNPVLKEQHSNNHS